MAQPLDAGSAHFDPSNLEFTTVDVGNKTVNVIPAAARARFNIRFNDHHTQGSLKALVEARVAAARGRRPVPHRMGAVERRCVPHRARCVRRNW